MESEALIEIGTGKITALNAAILANKLLQIASGAVYDTYGTYHLLDTDRYELLRALAEARLDAERLLLPEDAARAVEQAQQERLARLR